MVKNGCSAVSPALVDVPERTIASGLTFVIARAVLTLLHSTVPSDGIGEMSHRCRVLASPHGSGLAALTRPWQSVTVTDRHHWDGSGSLGHK